MVIGRYSKGGLCDIFSQKGDEGGGGAYSKGALIRALTLSYSFAIL